MTDEIAEALGVAVERIDYALLQARMYGGQHPLTVAAAGRVEEALAMPLAELGTVRFESGPDGLHVKDVHVSVEDDEKDGLGRQLHREGIAELTLQEGLTGTELARLLDILRLNLSLPQYEEETLEHLLWQAQFDCIDFRAVKALMEAEAISGDHQNFLQQTHKDMMEDIIARREEALRLMAATIQDDVVHRAMAENELQGLVEEEIEVDDTPWAKLLLDPEHPDYAELVGLRDEVAGERNADMMARVFLILCRTAIARRGELKPDEALKLADVVLEGLYETGVPFALMEASDGVEDLLDEHRGRTGPVFQRVKQLGAKAFEPMRVAKTLLALSPDTAYEDHEARELVRRLPDAAFLAVVERANAVDAEDAKWLQEMLARAAVHRVQDWLDDPRVQPERLVPTIGLMSYADAPEAKARRRQLLRHPAAPVRQAVLRWYARDLPPEDLEHVLHTLRDRSASVRRAAIEALAARKVKGTTRWLKEQVAGPGFKRYPADQKKDLCIALGEVAGDFGVDTLARLLEDGEGDEVVAAAAGLGAAGTSKAVAALKKGASSWAPSRRSACSQALQRLGAR